MLNVLKNKISPHLNKVFHDGDVEVTIYPTYGFLQGAEWILPLRGWVHQNRRLPDHLINEIAQAIVHCDDAQISNFGSRFDAFSDDSRSKQSVTIQFDADDERYTFQPSDLNGLIEATIKIPEATASTLREVWIRDVVNDVNVNEFRFDGVEKIIKAENIVCPTQEHYDKLAVVIQREYGRQYAKNNLAPCGNG